jgi:lysozyme family protein
MYWDVLLADKIINQSIAEILVDGKVNGGFSLANLQTYFGLIADGKMGIKTLSAINQANQAKLHAKLLSDRKTHYANLIKSQPEKYAEYADGWANRLKNFVFEHQTIAGMGLGALAIGLIAAYLLYNTPHHG